MKSRPLLVIVGLALAALTVALWRIPRPRPDLESQIEHAQARLASANLLLDQLQADLDTSRVPGWNEIDAVEIVGHDGSRQWASQAAASTSYADRRGNELPQQLGR